MRRIDFGIAHIALVGHQRLHHFAAAGGREAPIGGEAHQQKLRSGTGQGLGEVVRMCFGRVEIVQRPGDQQIGVGVKVLAELVALVPQITLDLKFNLLRAVFQNIAALQHAAKLGVHHIVAEVGDVAQHAGDAQTAFGHHAVFVEMTAMKVRVGDDGATRHFIECNVLGVQVGRTGNHHRMAQFLGVLQAPTQGLHAAQAATHDSGQLRDAQGLHQPGL